jgi:hypothetical protein
MYLTCEHVSELPGMPIHCLALPFRVSDSEVLKWNLKICISSVFTSHAEDADLGTTV